MRTPNSKYEQARARIEEMDFSAQELDFIFADWTESDHLNWLLTTSRKEIASWIPDEINPRQVDEFICTHCGRKAKNGNGTHNAAGTFCFKCDFTQPDN